MGEKHKQHLLNCIRKNYEITVDHGGTRYLGITLEWDYVNRKVHLLMPGYVPKVLKRFKHKPPLKPQDQPYPHVPPPDYGAKIQYAKTADGPSPPKMKTPQLIVACPPDVVVPTQ